jgi:hypothetical protein
MDKLEYPQRGHKPPKNHPWRRPLVKREVVEFAKEHSTNSFVNNYKKGGGKPQK